MPSRWIESLVVAVVFFGWMAVRYGWPGGRQLAVGLRAVRGWAGANPATMLLWLLVALHVWMLAGLPSRLAQAVLRVHSTNLAGLRQDPVSVLFTSAMWTDPGDLLLLTVAAVLLLGPAERWLGTARAVVVFLVGHIGATLLTAVWLSYRVAHGEVSRSVARTVDVGVSYGTLCLTAVLCYRLPLRWRLPALAVLAGIFVFMYERSDTFTDLGHCLSIGIGLLLYPLTRARAVRARTSGRWILVPVFPPPPGAPDGCGSRTGAESE